MSERFMRMLLFFDLPTETAQDRREYARFRKFLIKSGFMMVQESVYSKLLLHATARNLLETRLRKNKPPSGVIQLLTVTEKQYQKMIFLLGDYNGDILQSDERYVEL